jgi:hypothetical protein
MTTLKKVSLQEPVEWLEAFWAGQKPKQIPYTIYYGEFRHTKDDPYWHQLFEAGLRVTYAVSSFKSETKNVEYINDTINHDSRKISRQVMRTPVGEIAKTFFNGWEQEFWLKNAQDYRAMQYIVENTELTADYDSYRQLEQQVGPYGIVHVNLLRTPLQTILVDYVGLENFGVHLFELKEEMMSLYDALLKQFARRVEIVAGGPGRYVNIFENFTADTMGPKRFEQFHIPVYQKYIPMLQQSGKIVGTHFDGQLSLCSDLIANSPIDTIESLTPPPEGDMDLGEARKVWQDKLFWSNINVGKYQLEPQKLKQTVFDSVAKAAPDGRRLAFEVSEHIPQNWKESMPVVLEALSELN